MTTYHIPVLLRECIEGLTIKPNGVYVDVTFGGGGHSAEILKYLDKGKLVAFDQDSDAFANLTEDSRLIFCQGNFRFLKNFLRYHGIKKIDGLLADLGVSSHHFDTPERGFTFQGNSPLDMRMNQSAKITAAEILNTYPMDKLRHIFRAYGELDNAGKLASLIVAGRPEITYTGSAQLVTAISGCIPRNMENKYLAKVYQALRIEVNNELESLKSMLHQCIELMNPGGRLVVITYHSLEDRIVKNFTKTGNVEGKVEKDFYGNVNSPFKPLSNKVIVPTELELVQNSRSRSAKLRIAERITDKTNE